MTSCCCCEVVESLLRCRSKTSSKESSKNKMAKNKKAGPFDCVGCHDAEYQIGIEVIEEVPRLMRNQPDVSLVKTGEEALPKDQWTTAMNPVAFDHQSHENYSESCKVCHHASLQSCASCHIKCRFLV